MSVEARSRFGCMMDAFEDDLRLQVLRSGADGVAPAGRKYTKQMPPLGWFPCVGKGCQLGGFDLAHELGPLVSAHQRAVAMGTADREVDESVRFACVGHLPHGRGRSLECAESFIIHIVGTLRVVPGAQPAGAADNRRAED